MFVLNDRLSDEGAYGVDPGKHLLSSFGANLKGEVRYEFMKNMTVYSRLDLYSDYLDKPQNVVVNWEVQINMAINKWFSTTLTTNLMYDDDVKIAQKDGTKGPRVQFKEILGVGLQFISEFSFTTEDTENTERLNNYLIDFIIKTLCDSVSSVVK